jgi:large subunit ribosomal protein L5
MIMSLKEKYNKEVKKQLKTEFSYKNDMAVPRLVKATVNVGFGRNAKDKQFIDNVEKGLAKITGQKAVLAKSKKSISAFKIRKGMVIGAYASMRGQRMYDFVGKLINVTLPRVRDFRGISDGVVDDSGNMTIGFKEHTAFPEISSDDMDNVFGLEVYIATTAKSREEGLKFFKLLGFPMKEKNS